MAESVPEDLLRELAPQVLGALVRRYGHFDTAEDSVQEALLAASQQWPGRGQPDNPRAWLITVASRRLTDLLRNEQARQRREDTVAKWVLPEDWPDSFTGAADDTLILLFLCCHPSLSPASQHGRGGDGDGPHHGLTLLAEIEGDERLTKDHRLHAVRAHLLEQSGDAAGARTAYELAATLTTSLPQQRYLNAKATGALTTAPP